MTLIYSNFSLHYTKLLVGVNSATHLFRQSLNRKRFAVGTQLKFPTVVDLMLPNKKLAELTSIFHIIFFSILKLRHIVGYILLALNEN
jgi:hypothetical protein